jgi:hypothetical protein
MGKVHFLNPGDAIIIDLAPGYVRRIKARRGTIVILGETRSLVVGEGARMDKSAFTHTPNLAPLQQWAKGVRTLSVSRVLAALESIDDVSKLEAIITAEESAESPRTGITRALRKRIKALEKGKGGEE